MDQLKGSLRFIPLAAVTQFIAGLGSTGHLKLTQGGWSGEIVMNDGHIVGAQMGSERGRAALEGMVLALTTADFAFVDGLVDATSEPLLTRDNLTSFMAGLLAERERLHDLVAALDAIPCLIEKGGDAEQITIAAAALQLIPSLMNGHSIEQIAQRRGLARTLREVAMLRQGGLVRLEAPQAAVRLGAVSASASAESPAATVRPLRPVPPRQPMPAGVARRVSVFQQATAAAPVEPIQRVDLPRPRLVRSMEQPRPEQTEAVITELPAPGRGWRRTLRGLFIEDSEGRN